MMFAGMEITEEEMLSGDVSSSSSSFSDSVEWDDENKSHTGSRASASTAPSFRNNIPSINVSNETSKHVIELPPKDKASSTTVFVSSKRLFMGMIVLAVLAAGIAGAFYALSRTVEAYTANALVRL